MSNQTQRLKFTQLAASIALVAGGAAFVPAANAAAPTAGTNLVTLRLQAIRTVQVILKQLHQM